MEFYDIHSHILAKVDDGAETFEMSCRMLDMAYEEGIRHLCVTPHYNRHNADDAERPKKVMRAFRALELYAKKQFEWTFPISVSVHKQQKDSQLLLHNLSQFHTPCQKAGA